MAHPGRVIGVYLAGSMSRRLKDESGTSEGPRACGPTGLGRQLLAERPRSREFRLLWEEWLWQQHGRPQSFIL